MASKKTDHSVGAEDSCATAKTHRADRNDTGARSGVGRVRAPGSGLHAGLPGRRSQGSRGTGNCGIAWEEEDVGAAAWCRGSWRTPESLRVVGRDVSRSDSVASLEQTRRVTVGIEEFGNWWRESRGEIANTGEAEGRKNTGTAEWRRVSKETSKSMRVVKSVNGERGERRRSG